MFLKLLIQWHLFSSKGSLDSRDLGGRGTWQVSESNDPFEEKRCHYMKSLRNILSSSYGGERASVLQIECTTHLSSATPSKVTWIQWPLWGEKVSLHEKLKEHLVLNLWWWTGQVCYNLNCTTHLSSATPSKVTWIQWPLWGEKVSLHEKLKEHLVLKLLWWTGQVCYKLNCTTHLSSATPSKVTWIQWPLWGEKVSLYQKLKEHLVFKLWWWTGQVCYKLNVQLTCQVPRPPRSRESNDPFEVKRCHYMKSLRNILSSSHGGERGKCATPSKVTWIQWLLWSEKVSRHCMKSLRTIRSSNRASVLQIGLYYSPVKCHHVSLMTRGVLHGKSKEHLVCNLLWCMAWQAVNSTCLFNSSVVHYSSPPDWAIWSWTNTR